MLPSMLPPPTPFKLFVLSAGVAEMRFSHFLAAIFFGRFLRFCILSILVIRFGPEIVGFFGNMVHNHARLAIAIVAAAALDRLVDLAHPQEGWQARCGVVVDYNTQNA